MFHTDLKNINTASSLTFWISLGLISYMHTLLVLTPGSKKEENEQRGTEEENPSIVYCSNKAGGDSLTTTWRGRKKQHDLNGASFHSFFEAINVKTKLLFLPGTSGPQN